MKIILVLFLLIATVGLNAQDGLPSIQLKNIQGKNIDVESLTKEGLYLVSFWASWCVSCINELDEINDVYDEWQEEIGVELIAISTDDSRTVNRVIPLVNGKAWEYEVLFDTNQELKRRMNIGSIPYVIIVKDGKIVYQHSGYAPGQEDEIFEELKKHSNQ